MTSANEFPIQTEPLWVKGAPEGRDNGPLGFVEVDVYSGTWWVKTTPIGVLTGWQQFGSGGSGGGGFSLQGTSAPEGVQIAPAGTFYRRYDDPIYEFWYKESGNGNTGWLLILKLA